MKTRIIYNMKVLIAALVVYPLAVFFSYYAICNKQFRIKGNIEPVSTKDWLTLIFMPIIGIILPFMYIRDEWL